MLTMLGTPRRCCDGVTRREALQAGALALFGGMNLPNLLAAEERRPRGQRPGRAKSVILLYLLGGAATQDMFDLKPNAASGVKSEFRPIATRTTGIQVCEHLPRLARWTDRMAFVRSLNHKAGCHNTLPSYTGLEVMMADNTTTLATYPPSMGSVCEYLRINSNPSSAGRGDLPHYVYMPCYLGWGQAIRRAGPYAGFLGQRCDPLFTECSPYRNPAGPAPRAGFPAVALGEPRLPQSTLGEGLTIDRLNNRRSLLGQLDDQMRRADAQPSLDNFGRVQQRAFNLLTSSRVRTAFDLDREDPRLRDRYGRTLFGQSALIGRRLVESGVRFVNVSWDLFWDRVQIDFDCWDTHTRNFHILRDTNLPNFDQTYSTLLEDLNERGLLDETLVVVMSEMGRTPRVNGNAGRDHWTFCYGMFFAGAGIRGGTVCGESDAQAAYVKDRPVSTSDVCATIYQCLGIDPDMTVPDRSGRPMPVSNGGKPIREVLA
jgi:hypothetical protein